MKKRRIPIPTAVSLSQLDPTNQLSDYFDTNFQTAVSLFHIDPINQPGDYYDTDYQTSCDFVYPTSNRRDSAVSFAAKAVIHPPSVFPWVKRKCSRDIESARRFLDSNPDYSDSVTRQWTEKNLGGVCKNIRELCRQIYLEHEDEEGAQEHQGALAESASMSESEAHEYLLSKSSQKQMSSLEQRFHMVDRLSRRQTAIQQPSFTIIAPSTEADNIGFIPCTIMALIGFLMIQKTESIKGRADVLAYEEAER
ncbi:hypothetical protein HDU98_003386 [Podochytrium sp. JEL0797]|nr:hypothetical protein HDU98_003386 [Podochytrium sp. JEL0797]